MKRSHFLVVAAVAAVTAATAPGSAAAPAGVPDVAAFDATEPPLRDADYWLLADSIARAFDTRWSDAQGGYTTPGEGASVRTNANLLVAHAVAAHVGHHGAARQDARARSIVQRLTRRPVWRGTARAFPTAAVGRPSTCWATNFAGLWPGHMSLEPKVADALAWAWRARARLKLSRATAALIRREVSACARTRAWRYPALMGNQFNWYAEMYAAAATVSGSGGLLRRDYRLQLNRFAAGITRPMRGKRTANLGPGYSFRYHPTEPATAPVNIASAEYADIVLQGIKHYGRALRVGMRPLPARSMRLMRAWVTRVLAGNWTHAGYLNWDTGHGLARWHSAQYWAFAQQGLLAIATSRRFWADPRYGRWAKAIFDRSLILYARLVEEAGGGLAMSRMFGVRTDMEDSDCFNSRILAHVARAIDAGLGSRPAQDPPPLYAFDYDIGRLAVTTPHYSTAVVPVSRGAFEYGGIELARLFAAGQRPAAGIGGRAPTAFGIVARARGTQTFASQTPLTRRAPLRLLRSPRGRVSRPRAYPARPYAGPFAVLEASGVARGGGFSVRTTHRFSARAIETSWRVAQHTSTGHAVAAHFPTWGRNARIEAVLRDGSAVVLAGRGATPRASVPLESVRRIVLGTAAGYVLVPLRAPAGAQMTLVPGVSQSTAPDPGPTLAIGLAEDHRRGRLDLRVRILPFVAA